MMSETVTENVEQALEKKKWKAKNVRIAFAIFILIPFVAVWAGMQNIDSLVIVDFLFFFGLAMYGKISGKLETRESSYEFTKYDSYIADHKPLMIHDGPFSSDELNYDWKYRIRD